MSFSSQPQSSLPGFFAEDLVPALAQPSKFLDTLTQLVILAFLALTPFPSSITTGRSDKFPVQVQPNTILLLFASFAFFGGFFRKPSYEWNRILLVWLAGPWLAPQTVSKRVGTYFRVTLFMALIFYLPIYYNLPTPFQPWLQGLSLSTIAIVGFFSPIQKFHGPLDSDTCASYSCL